MRKTLDPRNETFLEKEIQVGVKNKKQEKLLLISVNTCNTVVFPIKTI